jgi:hypothetical protein
VELFGLVAVGCTIALVFFILREVYARGKLSGIRETMQEISRGVSNHYEHEAKEIPEAVAKAIDQVKASVARATGATRKCEAYRNHMWQLGNEMGQAAWQDGFEDGRRFADPRNGDIRIDLSTKELLNIGWCAHFGFENMMPKYNPGGLHRFKNEDDAYAAAYAIERLERSIPREYRDESDPYALAFNRQTMIRQQWPTKAEQRE